MYLYESVTFIRVSQKNMFKPSVSERRFAVPNSMASVFPCLRFNNINKNINNVNKNIKF